jgi:PAS domain S-box-containing protein
VFGFLVIVLLAGSTAYLQVRTSTRLQAELDLQTERIVSRALAAAQLGRDVRQLEVAVQQLIGEARKGFVHPAARRDAARDADRARDDITSLLASLQLHLASATRESRRILSTARDSGLEHRQAARDDLRSLLAATFHLSNLQRHVTPLADLSDSHLLKTDAYIEELVEPRLAHLTQLIDGFTRATALELRKKPTRSSGSALSYLEDITTASALAIALIALLLGAVISWSRRKSENLLTASEQRFRHIVETTSDWIWTTDHEGRITYSNPGLKHILGHEPQEVIGCSSIELLHEDERDAAAGGLARLPCRTTRLVGSRAAVAAQGRLGSLSRESRRAAA